MERGLEREGERETRRSTREGKKELWVSFYIPAPSPFSSNSKQLPLCAAMREPEVVASAFHRQAPIHSSGQLPPNRQLRRKSSSPTSPQECISHVFVSRMTLLSSHQKSPPPHTHARTHSSGCLFAFTFPSRCTLLVSSSSTFPSCRLHTLPLLSAPLSSCFLTAGST